MSVDQWFRGVRAERPTGPRMATASLAGPQHRAIVAMRVLHVAETIRGGIASYFDELLVGLGEGYAQELRFVVPKDQISDLQRVNEKNNVAFDRTGRNIRSFINLIGAVRAQLSNFRPDVVCVHSTFAGVLVRIYLMFRRARPAIVYCPHGWAFSREGYPVARVVSALVERGLAASSEIIICISACEMRAAVAYGIPRGKLRLVYNGIADEPSGDRPAKVSGRPLRVLYVGRFDPQKGFDLLLQAAAQLVGKVEVTMIGAPVVTRQAPPDMPANVSSLGWRPRADVSSHMRVADLVVVPSRWEAFGLVVVESMRAAKPVLAFEIGAMPELIVDGHTGLLVRDVGAAGLAAGFERALNSDLLAMGTAARERFLTNFTAEKLNQGLTACYREAVELRGSAR